MSLDSTAVDLHNILASTYAAQGRYALAIESLEKAVVIEPNYAVGFVNLGGVYTTLGQYEQAATHLQRAVQIDSDNSPVRRRLGELYLATARYSDATRELLEALRIFPNDATLYYYLGQSLAGEGRSADAIEAYQRATLLDLGFADAYYRLGLLARKQGHSDIAGPALKRFNHLRGIGGGDPEVPKQIKRMRDAILNAPEEAAHHYNLGLFFVAHGYFPEAENKFARAAALRPDDLDLLNRLSGDLLELDQPEAALRYLEAALVRDPAYFPALLNAGQIAGRLGRYEEAEQYLHNAVDARPDDPEGWALSVSPTPVSAPTPRPKMPCSAVWRLLTATTHSAARCKRYSPPSPHKHPNLDHTERATLVFLHALVLALAIGLPRSLRRSNAQKTIRKPRPGPHSMTRVAPPSPRAASPRPARLSPLLSPSPNTLPPTIPVTAMPPTDWHSSTSCREKLVEAESLYIDLRKRETHLPAHSPAESSPSKASATPIACKNGWLKLQSSTPRFSPSSRRTRAMAQSPPPCRNSPTSTVAAVMVHKPTR